MKVKQAVILAGGLGTRMRPLTDNLPKPMIDINGRPFLEHLIDLLKENGIEEVVLLLGYLPDKIKSHFGDGTKFGVKINYSIGEVSFDTGKRVKYAESFLDNRFLLMYGDNYFPFDLERAISMHEKNDALCTMTVYSNKDGFTKNNVLIDQNGLIKKYDKERMDPELNGVDIGFFIMDKVVVEQMPLTNFTLNDIFPSLIDSKKMFGNLTNHRYYSIGKIERLPTTSAYLTEKKVIFLDRDGVINEKAPKADYVKKWSEFRFLPGAKNAIAQLTKEGYEIYIISNQAGIARGLMTKEDLEDIHEKMVNEIEHSGGKINKIYYCPHGWDEGCECRKPKSGMLFQAARENNLNLRKTVFIGDDERDLQAGNGADVKTFMVDTEKNLLNVVHSLLDAPK